MSSSSKNSSETNRANNFFSNKSIHFGFNFGLISPSVPLIINELVTAPTGSVTSSSLIQSPANLGVTGGLTFDPIMTDHFSIGMSVNGCYGITATEVLLQGSTTSADGSTTDNTSGYFIGYNVGSNVTFGFKHVKLYLGYVYNYFSSSYDNDISITTTDYYGNTSTGDTHDNGSTEYSSGRIEMGIRLGSYKKTTYDLLYCIEKTNTNISNNVYKLVIWCPSTLKFFAEYGNWIAPSGTNLAPWKNGTSINTTSTYLVIGLVYSKDWFWHKKR